MRIAVGIIVLASAISGCAILVTEGPAVQSVDKQYLSLRRATFDCSGGLRNVSTAAPAPRPVYKQQIGQAWGEPDEIKVVENTEQWFYKKDQLWSGVWGVLVVIPIPFLVPTGREQMAIAFVGDQVSSVNVHYQHGSGGGCSLIPIPVPAGHGVFFGCQTAEASVEAELTPFCAYGERLNK